MTVTLQIKFFLPLNAVNTTLFLLFDGVVNEVNLHYIQSSQNTISHSQEKASNQTCFLYIQPWRVKHWRRRLSRKEKHSNIILKIQEGQCRAAQRAQFLHWLTFISQTLWQEQRVKCWGYSSRAPEKHWIMTQYQFWQTLNT